MSSPLPEHARFVPARKGEGFHEDRGSRFLAFAFEVEDEGSFQKELAALRALHPKARHHCWAWRLGEAHRFQDDGEPGGTAGRPIFQAIQASGLDRIGIVVVRYFGGVKLGTGGLARAYGTAATRALEAAGRRIEEERLGVWLALPYDLARLRGEIGRLCPGLVWEKEGFSETGWRGEGSLFLREKPLWERFWREKGSGRLRWGEWGTHSGKGPSQE
ncbi:MAG: IMPACT family protein [Planctomycetota bacterium]